MRKTISVLITAIILLVSAFALVACNKDKTPDFSSGNYYYESYAYNVNTQKYNKTGNSIYLSSDNQSSYTLTYAKGLMDISGKFSFATETNNVYFTMNPEITEVLKTRYDAYIDALSADFSESVIKSLKEDMTDTDDFYYDGDFMFDEGAIQCYRQLSVTTLADANYDFSGIEGVYQMATEEYTIALTDGKVYMEDASGTAPTLKEVGSYYIRDEFITMSIKQSGSGKIVSRYLMSYITIPKEVDSDSIIYDKEYVSALKNVAGKRVRVLLNDFYYKGKALA